ncbi:glycosyltransferase family 2 protein [Gluconacetobacter aggeris]|uniref:Glycosyltransferase family 2 protein n=1 Tax=Gluconacetobacter aggeris TaxID=1286186 RepID=A0A7W4IUX9_9PROT|nr:glycosyltransferase family 2 protein [Gluconacetobacter aggeris]MBB2169187.1 glycosyltransferase family 2 protein [Gluconacetobacter aggeris]
MGANLEVTPATRRDRCGKCLSVIAPSYNEAAVLDLFFEQLEPVLDACVTAYEIICINDGSRDATLPILLAHRRRNPRIKVIDFSRNFGKEVALTAGLDAAEGDMIVPMDVDLQDPPSVISEFVDRWEDGYDVVYGLRVDRSRDTLFKRLTSRLFYSLFNSLSTVDMPGDVGDFRLMDREVVLALRRLPERSRFMKGLFAWVGFRQVAVPYARPERAAGKTSWRYLKLWNFALDGVTAFSGAPIRVWSYVGGGAAAAAFLWALVIVLRTLMFGRDQAGYPSLAVFILGGFGLQMLAIGTLGEYVSRIYQEVKQRPLYLIRSRFGWEQDADTGQNYSSMKRAS